ncbi:hypothetical protein QBC44DRAFT_237210, partial [Cladorrhinum sp. PSN332]
GVIPTTTAAIPSTLPKAITPDTADVPTPDDTILIQIGFHEGYNYPFMVQNAQAAAQVFKYLPQALTDGADKAFDQSKVIVRRLVPLNTQSSLGFLTTCAIVTYPRSMLSKLEIEIKIPQSLLYNSPIPIISNLTAQINPAIPLELGAMPEGLGGDSGGSGPGGSGNSNSDPFNNQNGNGGSGSQKGTTAGIVTGAVFVAAAYGVVMFVIARRYKRKKQQHRRASSITSPHDMQESGRAGHSPALMGGALLSRDFTGSYGATAGTTSGGRNSHGSGRSGASNSGRLISAPVAAENSLGWN